MEKEFYHKVTVVYIGSLHSCAGASEGCHCAPKLV